ncbi:MAG: glycosyltransferase family 87 protein [Planctomycetota bacterium]
MSMYLGPDTTPGNRLKVSAGWKLPPLIANYDWRGWLVWSGVLIGLTAFALSGDERTVTPCYREAAIFWLQSHDLYNGAGDGFLYLPQAAIAFVPFALLPTAISEALWRCLSWGLFSAGVWRLARLARRETGCPHFVPMSFVCAPIAWVALRNGQSTCPMAGLMMLAVVDLAGARWTRSAVWLSLGLILKPLIVPLMLVVAVLHRPMRLRIAAGIAGVALLPFLLQHPTYALQQYVACWETLGTAYRVGDEGYWAQLFGMLKVAGVAVSPAVQSAARAVAAVATLGLCHVALKRYPAVRAHILLYSFVAIYLMLFNSRTENNTYALLAPAVAAHFTHAIFVKQRFVAGSFSLACAIALFGAYEIGKLFAPPGQAVWLAPLACLAFSGPVLFEVLRGRESGARSVDGSVLRARANERVGGGMADARVSHAPSRVAA